MPQEENIIGCSLDKERWVFGANCLRYSERRNRPVILHFAASV